MKRHLANAAYGALDYMAYPAGMLVLAPVILRGLGIERFGVWSTANAALMTGAVLASGFGDANIRAVAQARDSSRADDVADTVRSALGIHLALGGLIAAIGWGTARWMAAAMAKGDAAIASDALWSLRIAAVLTLIRTVETVCVSTQRAFGRYGTAIHVSVLARVASLALARLVPALNRSASAVMLAALAVGCMALAVQIWQLMQLIGVRLLTPMFHGALTRGLLGFGIFTWLQAVASLLVGQV
ncbi:MAG TPA: hypothetical protein VN151_04375, partial [Terracidiphilus sp.]|nr:hypothetical protein [Terracidiphilus sp.]